MKEAKRKPRHPAGQHPDDVGPTFDSQLPEGVKIYN